MKEVLRRAFVSSLNCRFAGIYLWIEEYMELIFGYRYWIGLIAFWLGLVSICVQADPVKDVASLSLLDAYKLARKSDPGLAISRYRVDGAEAQRGVAVSKIFPQINLFGQISENELKYNGSAIYQDQNYPGERYGVQVRQALLQVADGLEASRLNLIYRQSKEELLVSEAELLTTLLQAYLNVILAELDKAQFESELKALNSQLLAANALYARNLLPITQVLETQTRANILEADVIMSKGNSAVAREELIKLIGLRNFELVAVQERVALLGGFANADNAVEEATRRSPAIAVSQTALAAAKRGIDRERSNWIPEIDLTYSYQHSDVGFDNLSSPPRDTSTIAIGFNYPLFQGGAGSARLRGAWAEFYTAKTLLEAEQRESEARARAAWLNFETTGQRLIATRQAIKTAETAVDAARKAVKAGTARFTDVLLALAQNTRAQRDLGMAKFQYVLSWLELELATGGNPITLAPTISSALHGK